MPDPSYRATPASRSTTFGLCRTGGASEGLADVDIERRLIAPHRDSRCSRSAAVPSTPECAGRLPGGKRVLGSEIPEITAPPNQCRRKRPRRGATTAARDTRSARRTWRRRSSGPPDSREDRWMSRTGSARRTACRPTSHTAKPATRSTSWSRKPLWIVVESQRVGVVVEIGAKVVAAEVAAETCGCRRSAEN